MGGVLQLCPPLSLLTKELGSDMDRSIISATFVIIYFVGTLWHSIESGHLVRNMYPAVKGLKTNSLPICGVG